MRYLTILVFILTSACAPTTPPQPSPQVQQLTDACNKGDMDACKFLTNLEAQSAAQRQAAVAALGQNMARQNTNSVAGAYWAPQQSITPLSSSAPMQTTTRCNYVFGSLVCNHY